jgi:hypothetical protein
VRLFDNVIELALTKFLQDQGTLYKFSCVERPEHNSVVEREHNTTECCKSSLFQIQSGYISFSLINRMLSPILNDKPPFHKIASLCV